MLSMFSMRLITLLITLTCTLSCLHPTINTNSNNTNNNPSNNPLNTLNVISLLLPHGNAGHACPCNDLIYTARHVIQPLSDYGVYLDSYHYFTWQDGHGNHGIAQGVAHDDYRDLGRLILYSSMEDSLGYYKIADFLPPVGDKVYWIEFKANSFKPNLRESRIDSYFAGYAFLESTPKPGASGTCLFNSDGDVIGIVVWNIVRGSKKYGVATLLTDQ